MTSVSGKLRVPGNILLAGEYGILEEGGLGLALALDCELEAVITPSSQWTLEGLWPGGGESWHQGLPAQTIGSRVMEYLLGSIGLENFSPIKIQIDSQGFFDSLGRKMGYGSSAAAACAITAALMRQKGYSLDQIMEKGPLLAVDAHRYAQGGKGSGYDVVTSFIGSMVLFMGGNRPSWERGSDSWLPPLFLFPGPKAVKTQSAIQAWTSWKQAHPQEAFQFLRENNGFVKALSQCRSWDQALPIWSSLKALGIDLGRSLGVSAEIDVSLIPGFPHGSEVFWKASGAGNETGLLVSSVLPPGNFSPLRPSKEGLQWIQMEAIS